MRIVVLAVGWTNVEHTQARLFFTLFYTFMMILHIIFILNLLFNFLYHFIISNNLFNLSAINV